MENEIIVINEVGYGVAYDLEMNNRWDEIPTLIRDRALFNLNGKGSIIFNPVANEWQRIERSKIKEKIVKILSNSKLEKIPSIKKEKVKELEILSKILFNSISLRDSDILKYDMNFLNFIIFISILNVFHNYILRNQSNIYIYFVN